MPRWMSKIYVKIGIDNVRKATNDARYTELGSLPMFFTLEVRAGVIATVKLGI